MGTLIKPTTLAKKMPGSGGAGSDLTFCKYRNAGNTGWVDCGFIKRRNSGNTAWVWVYSTPDVTAGVSGSGAGSGASTSGTAARSLSASPGGVNSGTLTYGWARQSGDTGTYVDSSTAQNPTLKQDFSSVANGTTSTGSSSVWRCTITDTVTGAQAYSDVSISAFSWQNTIPALGPFVYTAAPASSSGASSAGAGITIHRVVTPSTTATFSSGGPISGSMTYGWSRTSGASGSITINNAALQSPTWTIDYLVPQATSDSRSETWQCLVTDTVSGLTYTITGVTVSDSYVNNTG